MVKEIVKDVMFLSQKSEKATEKDKYIANDLLDTLKANKDRCVGLAANMIGYNKAIICVSGGIYDFIMINPVITYTSGKYQTEEGCLSLIGERECKRCFQRIYPCLSFSYAAAVVSATRRPRSSAVSAQDTSAVLPEGRLTHRSSPLRSCARALSSHRTSC